MPFTHLVVDEAGYARAVAANLPFYRTACKRAEQARWLTTDPREVDCPICAPIAAQKLSAVRPPPPPPLAIGPDDVDTDTLADVDSFLTDDLNAPLGTSQASNQEFVPEVVQKKPEPDPEPELDVVSMVRQQAKELAATYPIEHLDPVLLARWWVDPEKDDNPVQICDTNGRDPRTLLTPVQREFLANVSSVLDFLGMGDLSLRFTALLHEVSLQAVLEEEEATSPPSLELM